MCGVPGRFIGENVAYLRDVVDYVSQAGVSCAVLSLDQEKAFDRVDWSFMRATLSSIGFGPSFIGWIDLFYSGSQSAVNVNGHVLPYFSLSRGVHVLYRLCFMVAEVFGLQYLFSLRHLWIISPRFCGPFAPSVAVCG